MKTKNISIIGYGELGRAIHQLLKQKPELAIKKWDKKDGPANLVGVVSSADIIFLCVPSWCLRAALLDIKKYIKKESLIISLSKGIEYETLKTPELILKDELGVKQPIGLLSGPMLAEELMSSKKGFAVFSSKNKKYFTNIADIFSKTNLNVEYSNDLRGVALCGVLKNIYSLGLGICDGLNLGGNTKGYLAAQSIKEISEILVSLGGKKVTIWTMAGAADFISTSFSGFSRNREVGEELARTGICCLESEGYKSIESLIRLLGKKTLKLPFLNTIKTIILDNKRPLDSFSNLL